ncbi:MAG TPA: hypothetical protein VJL80_14000 [Aeromicrobium sp.]|nr:hypothetical protein [Aeromicrobium sp.]HKY59147.1 hypothetical protein [Aeromicrobium sp.]
MLTVKWELASGESGQIALDNEDKWSFGRVGAEEPPTVVTEDPRISRNALTVRDSGPGPVVFRGQRGDAVSIRVVNVDGTERPIPEGTAYLLDEHARRIELLVDGAIMLTVQVLFDLRPTVKERQELADADASEADGDS